MADTRHQIELDVGAALECAEAATWTANELVAPHFGNGGYRQGGCHHTSPRL
jgi:hypothetical protein